VRRVEQPVQSLALPRHPDLVPGAEGLGDAGQRPAGKQAGITPLGP
jgi:hypothetical protein